MSKRPRDLSDEFGPIVRPLRQYGRLPYKLSSDVDTSNLWPQKGDPQLVLPTGNYPSNVYVTPLRVANNGQFFYASRKSVGRIRLWAKHFERKIKVKAWDFFTVKVFLIGGDAVPWFENNLTSLH